MTRALLIVALAIASVAPPPSAAQSPTIPFDQYITALEEIDALLTSKQIALAQERARALSTASIDWPLGGFHADAALLETIAATQRADLQLQSRLETTIRELRDARLGIPVRSDPDLLKRVAAEQDVPELVPGGDVPVGANPPPLIHSIARAIREVFHWIGDKIGKLLDWLLDLVPDGEAEGEAARPRPTSGMRWIVTALVAAIVLLLGFLAIEVMRRGRRAAAPAVATSTPIESKRDEDPLSRGANEWERYAAQLAAAGRLREAIRAWYHAVLVTCYSAGLLHYRKHRTNWEYIASLQPSVPWRAEFIRLTQRFEREWYGSDRSTEEALDDCARSARSIIDRIRAAGRGAA